MYKVRYKVEQWQLAFNYGIRNPKSGDDGKEEYKGMLVLRIATIKYLAV